jgi:hypothetical protein
MSPMTPATFAAYVPFPPYVPPTKTRTAATELQTPAPAPQTQGLTEGGIIILICLVGLLFVNLIDRK